MRGLGECAWGDSQEVRCWCSCAVFCPRCRIPRNASNGHCRADGKRHRCARRIRFTTFSVPATSSATGDDGSDPEPDENGDVVLDDSYVYYFLSDDADLYDE